MCAGFHLGDVRRICPPLESDTVWGGTVQKLVDEDEVPKGMRAVLEERGVDTTRMQAKDMRGLHVLNETKKRYWKII